MAFACGFDNKGVICLAEKKLYNNKDIGYSFV